MNTQANAKPTILVVDDMPENIDVLRGILGRHYALRLATNGELALRLAAAEPQPNLILLDIMMPGMDGYEVCRRLKANAATRDIPVIFVSALNSAQDETKGLELGAIDYLTKPVNASIALARIRNHLELKQHQDQLMELNRSLELRVKAEVAKNMESERLKLLGQLFDLGHEAVIITDASSYIVAVNRACSAITGYAKEEVLGKTPKIMRSGRHDAKFYQKLWQQLTEQGFWQGEIWNKRKNGEIYPQWLSISAVRDQDGEVVNYISTFTDISEHMEVQEKIRHMALHDTLTGLPNRAAMREHLERAVLRADRHRTRLAVVMIDLDHFKEVNDTMGHAAGDLLLIGVGGRMENCLRADDFISRLGGDEFVLILHDVNTTEDVVMVCGKLLESISEPYLLNGQEAHVTPSMGIAIFPDDGRNEDVLLAHADAAMYRAKTSGRANYVFYSSVKRIPA